MKEQGEQLFRAIGEVGGDLVDEAEHRTFPRSFGARWLPVAAMVVLLAGVGLWALPQLQRSAPAAETQGTREAAAPEKQAELAVPLPEEAPKPVHLVLPEQVTVLQTGTAQMERASVRETVDFQNTRYYIEGTYAPEKAEPLLGAALGSVEFQGRTARLYEKKGAESRELAGGPLPLEAFIRLDDQYFYGLTYYEDLRPMLTPEILAENWDQPGTRTLLQHMAGSLETILKTGEQAESLSTDQLLEIFRLTLSVEREAGLRTEELSEYLWYEDRQEAYVVPLEDVTAQLSRWLPGFTLEPEQSACYDTEAQCFLLQNLAPLPAKPVQLELPEPEQTPQGLQLEAMVTTEETTHRYTLISKPDGLKLQAVETVGEEE